MKFPEYWKSVGDRLTKEVPDAYERVEDACNVVFDDAVQLTIGAVVTKLWDIARKTTDKVDAARIKNIAAQIAAMDL